MTIDIEKCKRCKYWNGTSCNITMCVKERGENMKNIDYSKLNEITVKTQAELDEIPLNFKGRIYIECGPNDWLQIRHNYHLPVVVNGNSTVVVCAFPGVVNDFPIVEAYGTSCVKVNGYSLVNAFDKSTVEAFENSTVEAFDNSSVMAFDKSNVEAFEDSFVAAYDDSSVRVFDNSSVKAFGNTLVRAFDSAFVEALDYSNVKAYDNSRVEADEYATIKAYANSSIKAFGNVQVVDFGAKIQISDNARIVPGL
jgi:hypothetical protein